jgi:ubiquinone/menaquinone biosynthesis C-methylase UbiE
MTIGDDYIFPTGDAAALRLQLLEKVYGGSTRAFLHEAGLKSGMLVAEIGCGAGFTSCQIAKSLEPTGSLTAVDVSAQQLAIAKANAQRASLENIQFVEANATTTGLPTGYFDLVYCRLLLCHLRQVPEALNEFRRILKPGGTLACEDQIASQVFSSPETAVYVELQDMVTRFGSKQGVDYSIGRRLPNLVKSAGFDIQRARMVQPAYFSGEEKRWWESSVREAGPMLLKTGFLNQHQLDELFTALEAVALDPEVMVAQPVMTQVWARRRGQ